MKKALVFVLVALLAVGTVFASAKGASEKDSISVGLNLGTSNGAILNFGFGQFDLETIIGFGVINGSGLSVEVAGNFEVVDVAEQCNFAGSMPFTVGGEGYLSTDFDFLGMGALVPLKLTYTFPKVPVSLYFRFAPGVHFDIVPEFNVKFGVSASLGATYNF